MDHCGKFSIVVVPETAATTTIEKKKGQSVGSENYLSRIIKKLLGYRLGLFVHKDEGGRNKPNTPFM